MPIKTTTWNILGVTNDEVNRVNDVLTANDTLIAKLRADLAAATAPPAPPPPATFGGLMVVGPQLVSVSTGAAVVYRGIETLWGPNSAEHIDLALDAIKMLGASFVAPLFQRGQSTAGHVRACIQGAEKRRMGCAVNADAAGVNREWLKRPDIVAECNAGRGVILECEVELGDRATMTAEQWRDLAISFVLDLRKAGHLAPIRVGSPSGGRSPGFALKYGAAVLAADPRRSCIFTLQLYWDDVPSTDWEYATSEGFSRGTAGALECLDALKASQLCWLVGLDGKDDIGTTPYLAAAARCHQYGIAWQWWAMFVGDAYGNGLVNDPLIAVPKGAFGVNVRNLLTEQSRPMPW
jgi:hypothetical protein